MSDEKSSVLDSVSETVGFLRATVERNTQDITDIKGGINTLRECVTRGHTELAEKVAAVGAIIQEDKERGVRDDARRTRNNRLAIAAVAALTAIGVKIPSWL
tara:strand:- start:1502 stop:1807 length:306 start_codon:yes stop_codon:yes gene_type:complete